MATEFLQARTASLDIAYEQTGPDDAPAVLLLHGFPYDIRESDELRICLSASDLRVIVPYSRGFGPTVYRSPGVVRSGQQAALGKDIVDLLDALHIDQAVLAGYDWGGRAACVAAALWPDRVRGLVTTGYTIQSIAKAAETPQSAEQELQLWYQWYFQTERGRLGLEQNRHAICRLLWRMWSPRWHFADNLFNCTAQSFENPDFIATVIHSYRHRYGNVPGDPTLDHLEERLKANPAIRVPAITVHGGDDQVEPASASVADRQHFTAYYERRVVSGVGHCISAELPPRWPTPSTTSLE